MQQRKDDAVIDVINGKIDAIHERLDKVEDLSTDFKEIKEWISTVVKVTRLLEMFGCFIEKWSIRFLKIGAVFGMGWAAIKVGAIDVKDFIRWLFLK